MLNVKTLTDTMSRMELPDLQKYAAMHKNDPYIVTLALSIANQKKQMKAGQAGQAGMMPQPRVVDQQIAGMAPPPQQMDAAPQQQMLPEDTGIGQLPAQNMQNMAEGGIVAFEDGGQVPGYKEGGRLLSTYIDTYSKKYNVDPAVLSRIIQVESEGKTTAKNPKSTAHGAGQLLDDMWKKMGGGSRGDAETQVRNAAKLLRSNTDNFKNATGREPSASEAYVTWVLGDSTGRAVLAANPKASVEDVITKADPKNAADIIKSNASLFKNKSVSDVTQWAANKTRLPSIMPVSTAQAAPPVQAPVQAPAAPVQAAPPVQAIAPSAAPRIRTEAQSKEELFKKLGDVTNFFFGDKTPPPPASTSNAVNEREALLKQIPAQTSKAPPAKPVDTSFLSPGQFESGAESLGLSKDVGRNVFNTLMAPTPLSPVTTLPKTSQSGLGIAALGDKLYNKMFPVAGMSQKEIAALRAQTEAAKAADLAQAGQLVPRLTPPAKVIEAGSDAIPVTRTGDAVVQSAADLEKTRLANQAADQLAATQAAARTAKTAENIPSAAERLQQASFIRESDEAARLMARARAATNAKTTAQTAVGAANVPEGIAALDEGMNYGYEQAPMPELAKEDEKAVIAKLKEQTGATTGELKQQAADNGMDFNSFLIRFGLGLMAGESQYAAVNVGKAGLGALDAQLAEQKSRQAQAASLSDSELKKMQAKYYGSYAEAIERGAKEKDERLQAETLVQQHMEKWMTGPGQVAVVQNPNATAIEEARYRKSIYQQLGLNPIMAAGAPTGVAKFLGFENPT
jgi:hypothetical protein